MPITKRFREAFAGGTVALSAFLAGCNNGDNEVLNRVDLVNRINANAVGVSEIEVFFPDKLESRAQGKIIDLTDPKQVAEAMGLPLTGEPDQFLYTIIITDGHVSKSDIQKSGVTKREIPITVATVKEGADIINSVEKLLVKDYKTVLDPKNFIAPASGEMKR